MKSRRDHLIARLSKKHKFEIVSQIDKLKFYEVKSEHGVAFTACLVFGENGTILARGVSICSVAEKFSRKDGRNRSMGRAIRAIDKMKCSDAILPGIRRDWETITRMVRTTVKSEDGDVIRKTPVSISRYLNINIAREHFTWKSEWLPTLTVYEKGLLEV